MISLFTIGCAHDPTGDASATSNLSGGSAAHIDSLKTVASGTPNTLGTKDTLINGQPITSPTDSAQKKKP